MTQIQVLVEGTDRTNLIDWKSLKITKRLTSQVDNASFRYTKGNNSWTPAEDDEVIIKFDNDLGGGLQKVFGGYVVGVDDNLDGAGNRVYSINCKDYNHILDRRLVVATFNNQNPLQILNSLIAEYAYGEGITTTSVDAAPIINRIDFKYVSLRQAIQKIAELTYKDWYIDEDKVIHLFNREDVIAPFILTDTNGNLINGSLSVKTDITQLKNRVVVRGGEYEGTSYTDRFAGESIGGTLKNIFVLGCKPKISGFALTVGGVSKTIGIDGLADETAVDAVVSQFYRTLRFTAGNEPATGVAIVASYIPILQVIVAVESTASIKAYGYKEYTERDVNISSKQAAIDLGNAILDVYANPIIDGSFSTYTHQLNVGQMISINSTHAGINDDFLIDELVFRTATPNNFIYQAGFTSARRQGINEILQKLLTMPDRTIESFTDEQIEKIEVKNERIAIIEVISYQLGGDYTSSEDIVITEDWEWVYAPKTWVHGPYNPTSISDTKRPMFWNHECNWG
jgi:hypothetical protein